MTSARKPPLRDPFSPVARAGGFTMLELLVVMALVVGLIGFALSALNSAKVTAATAVCSNNLRQLSSVVSLYAADHGDCYPAYETTNPDGSRTWYFGLETTPAGTAEGDRDLDPTQGPLYPYIQEVGKIEICPAFNYGSALWKPKFQGASYGYGYNWILGGTINGQPLNTANLSSAEVMLFADCGQVNTFQPPASASNPMMEEFYLIDSTDKTFHFRHLGKANVLFVDGHVELLPPYTGTTDTRIPGQIFGRVTPVGSNDMLK